jgi:branched-chain amino acid transport system permease protein
VFYREAGQFKSTYAADMAVFPIRQDRIGIAVILLIAFVAIPMLGNDFFISSVMIPFLVFSLAAIGLNILTGYTGLISLGTAAFMGVGAYSCYKLTTIFPGVNVIVLVLVSGLFSAAIGVFFGLPSLRIKGFYLAVSPRSSSCNGPSCACPGCSTTTPRARSRCRSACSSACR